MIELIQITNDLALARRCDALGGIRLWVDLERIGKAERQAGRNTFISTHTLDDVARVKSVLTRARLMVRVNPMNEGTAGEVDDAITQGADILMLPMFSDAATLREFARLIDGRCDISPLIETSGALASVGDWAATPGLCELYVGLNDLHLAMGLRFMFEPLAAGLLEPVAEAARANGLRFGFGGIAQLDEGLLPGRDVLAEHVRLGSQAVILSRTFHQGGADQPFEAQIVALREAETALRRRPAAQLAQDQVRIAAAIHAIAAGMKRRP